MKKTLQVVLISSLLAVSSLSALSAYASEHTMPSPKNEYHGMMGHYNSDNHVNHFLNTYKKLNLSKTQKEHIRQIIQTEMASFRNDVQQTQKEVTAVITSKPFDEAMAQKIATEQTKRMETMRILTLKIKNNIYNNVLTPEQQQKVINRDERMENRSERINRHQNNNKQHHQKQ